MMVTCETCGAGYNENNQLIACPHYVVPEQARDALKAAHHALTVLSGLYAYDGADPARTAFQVDESATLRLLEAVLPTPPWEVPGGGAACVAFGGEKS